MILIILIHIIRKKVKEIIRQYLIMILSIDEKNSLMKRFPEIELSYEDILHRKVYTDAYVIIPKGKKFITWFTYFKNQHVCLFLELNRSQNVCDISIKPVCFDSELALGTILYGTFFTYNNSNYYSIENIHLYKGKDIDYYKYNKKLDIIKSIFTSDIRQISYTKNCVIFALPVICSSYNDANNLISSLPYSVYSIQFRSMKHNNSSVQNYLVREKVVADAVFAIKPDTQNDIYYLYYKDFGEIHKHTVANICDYKTSVMMNNLFRSIKENTNLDALEESDDEEEFENISDDKFVNLNKCVHMKCIYNKRFNKWKPIETVSKSIPIITKKQLLILEKI